MQSFDRETRPAIEPSAWFRRWMPLVPSGATVIDLACGHGRHTRWLAKSGYRVIAVDIDIAGVADAGQDPAIEVLAADLEDGPWPFAPGSADAIIVANYLHRPHFPALVETLAGGGLLLIETFGAGNEQFGRPRNPDFLLKPGELLEAFHPALQIIAYEHGLESAPKPAVRQRLCALKGAGLQALPGYG